MRNRKPCADVAARLAAVLVVDRVDLAELVGRAAGGRDRRDQRVAGQLASTIAVVGGAVVVLDLLEAMMSGDLQVVDDQAGQRGRTWPARRRGRGSRR